MATTKITTTNSRFTTGANNPPFGEDADNFGPDSLIVDAGAYLIGTGTGSEGALLANKGAWTVTVNGAIWGNESGITLAAGNTAASTITIGAEGTVGSQGVGGIIAQSAVTIKNSGFIEGYLSGVQVVGPGAYTITNSSTGIIEGSSYSIIASDGSVNVTNSGRLGQSVLLGNGADRLTNSGSIEGTGRVDLAGGHDVMTNFIGTKSGTVSGHINLGYGNDKFFGGNNAEIVEDDDGSDLSNLGGGADTYIATGHDFSDGFDTINGGSGIDTYDFSDSIDNIYINLDIVGHDFGIFVPGAGFQPAKTAWGGSVADSGHDTVTGFENVKGGSGDDHIFGTAGANVLEGGDGINNFFAYGGNDTLIGGADLDVLVGGAGRDRLIGGGGGDFFSFASKGDSGITRATRDFIVDFQDGIDMIDLFHIDANTTNGAGNDAFVYLNGNSTTTPGATFTGVAGQLRSYLTAEGHVIEGDVNGDIKADFSIAVGGFAATFTSADFFL